jgi:hypothetical protein
VAAPATQGGFLVDPAAVLNDDSDEVMSTSSYYSYASDTSSPITPLKKRLKLMNGGIVHGLPRGSLPGTPASVASSTAATPSILASMPPLSLTAAAATSVGGLSTDALHHALHRSRR